MECYFNIMLHKRDMAGVVEVDEIYYEWNPHSRGRPIVFDVDATGC